MTAGPKVIAVGASAGGVEALQRLCAGLPGDLDAAVLVVLHVAPTGMSVLPSILSRAGALPACVPIDGEPISPGNVYVAPPDRHLEVSDGRLFVGFGPRENGHRPAVDPLFRSVARAYGRRGAGVILSGTRDDGAIGLCEIRDAGGWAIVQDPQDALYDGMPRSALMATAADAVLPIAGIAEAIVELVRDGRLPDGLGEALSVRDDGLVPGASSSGDPDPDIPDSSSGVTAALQMSCPECSGVLTEISHHPVPQFRCQVGHQYSIEHLVEAQGRALEEALWAAIRSLEERALLLRRAADRAGRGGHALAAKNLRRQSTECHDRADVVRRALPTLVVVDGSLVT